MRKQINNSIKKDTALIAKNEINEISKLLKKVPGLKKVQYDYSFESSVSLDWGVDYSPSFICREVLQNARDGAISQGFSISDIKTILKSGQIIVQGPSDYNLKLLFYIGGTKANDESQLGKFGEGSLISVVSLIKLGIEYPIFISGNEAVAVSVSPEENEVGLRPLIYNFFKISNSETGSKFVINTFKENIRDAFKCGLEDHFFWPENPHLGELLHSYNHISFYKSNKENGIIFYNGLNRGEIDLPLILVIEKKYKKIENKVASDRDRNSFTQDLRSQLFNIVAQSGLHYRDSALNPAIKFILEELKPLWLKGQGHPLLSSICNNVWNLKSDESKNYLEKLFSPIGRVKGYYSESSPRYSSIYGRLYWELEPKIYSQDRHFEKKGYIKLPSYFSRLGIKSSVEILQEKKKRAEEKAKKEAIRLLNSKETKAINFLLQCLREVAPGFAGVFYCLEDVDLVQVESEYGGLYNISFKVLKSDKVLGELKDSQSQFDEKTVLLNEKLFSQSFGSILSTLTHELQHAFGLADGQRAFSDGLTILLKIMIDHPDKLKLFKNDWEKYRII